MQFRINNTKSRERRFHSVHGKQEVQQKLFTEPKETIQSVKFALVNEEGPTTSNHSRTWKKAFCQSRQAGKFSKSRKVMKPTTKNPKN